MAGYDDGPLGEVGDKIEAAIPFGKADDAAGDDDCYCYCYTLLSFLLLITVIMILIMTMWLGVMQEQNHRRGTSEFTAFWFVVLARTKSPLLGPDYVG